MKKFLIPLAILLICAFVITGCGGATTTKPATSAATPPVSTTAAAPPPVSTTAAAPPPTAKTTAPPPPPPPTTTPMVVAPPPPSTVAGQQIYGGTLRIILGGSPVDIGYAPDQSFADVTPGTIWSERMTDLATNGDLKPCLAESWETSADGLTVTYHLRKGVKFQDGTDWNAAAAKWNLDLCKATGALPGAGNFTSINVVDDYTLKFSLQTRNILAPYNIGRPYFYSPTAFQKNGKDWCYTHAVSTASFMVTDFQRDVSMKLVKNPNYWRPNRPYMDALDIKVVKESATASALIQSGQADIWQQAGLQEAADLKDKGFPVVTGPNVINNIYGDSKNATSPFAKKEVREAIEYSLDRAAMAKALGYGFATPINQLTPPGTAGYNPNYVGRPYDPAKAKQLLAQAGYPNGLKAKLMILSQATNAGTIIKNYLAAIGIDVTIDIADSGRYWGSIFVDGWHDLLLGVSALNPEYAVVFLDHFGPYPLVKFVSLAKTPEFLAACNAIYVAPDIPSMRKATQVMVTQASQDCMAIPMYYSLIATPMQKYVHTTFTTAIDWTGWYIWDDWMDKH